MDLRQSILFAILCLLARANSQSQYIEVKPVLTIRVKSSNNSYAFVVSIIRAPSPSLSPRPTEGQRSPPKSPTESPAARLATASASTRRMRQVHWLWINLLQISYAEDQWMDFKRDLFVMIVWNECCCCEQPIGKQQNFFTAIWLDAHNVNICSVGYSVGYGYDFNDGNES